MNVVDVKVYLVGLCLFFFMLVWMKHVLVTKLKWTHTENFSLKIFQTEFLLELKTN